MDNQQQLYYCLHDCIINKIECKQGEIKSLEDWKKHLQDYPHKVVEWNRFYFYPMKDEKDLPTEWWGNGSMKNKSIESFVIKESIKSYETQYNDLMDEMHMVIVSKEEFYKYLDLIGLPLYKNNIYKGTTVNTYVANNNDVIGKIEYVLLEDAVYYLKSNVINKHNAT